MRNMLKWLTFGLIAGTGAAVASPAQMPSERLAEGYWQTDKAKVLDSLTIRKALATARSAATAGDTEVISNEQLRQEVIDLVAAELSSESNAVHMETVLAALGAVSGFACQMIIREEFIATGKIKETDAFMTMQTRDGQTFFMGNLLNEGLAEARQGNLSVWSLVGGAVQHVGKPLPDLKAIFARSAGSIGKPEFGQLSVSARNQPLESPEALLAKFWNPLRNLIATNRNGNIGTMHLVLAQAAQAIILKIAGLDAESAPHIDATLAAQIVMEAAVDMSKVSPDRVPFAYISD